MKTLPPECHQATFYLPGKRISQIGVSWQFLPPCTCYVHL